MTETAACVVCAGTDLKPHLTVRVERDASLVATTTSYGSAPDHIVRCAACGHMQVAVFPEQSQLDSDYGDVEEAAYVEEEAGQRATAARIVDRIERHVPGRGRLADLGCWVGFLLAEAGRRGWSATGVEPSRFASSYARERLGLDVVTATLDAPLDGREFEAVFLGDVIEHLPDPVAALRRSRSLLVRDGVVCLAVPDAGSRVARLLGTRWWSVIPTHVQYFTRGSLTRLLEANGFAVEWIGTAPKGFTVRYYLERLTGYSAGLAKVAVRGAEALGVADRLVWPDFRDRMLVVARKLS